MERLQRAAEAGGRVLKAERLDPGGAGAAQRAAAFLVTFDVGRLLLSVDPGSGELTSHYLEPGEEAPPGLLDAAEEEPWWRILGAPLVRVWSGEAAAGGGRRGSAGPSQGGRGLLLQFRDDAANPRIVSFDPEGPLVRVSLAEAEPQGGAQ
jgi:hypothetical protein